MDPRQRPDAQRSLQELARLAETAGSVVLEGVVQRRSVPDPATYVGSGKAIELRDIVQATGADTVICDGELTPGQLRKLEAIVQVKVVGQDVVDPGHIRPTCTQQRGQGAGRAGPDGIHVAATARLGRGAEPTGAGIGTRGRERRRSRPTADGSGRR